MRAPTSDGNPVPELPAVDAGRALRQTLGRFPTGVTVVSTRAPDGSFVGLTANSFSALSLDPPLISWALRLASASLPVFQQSPRFVVNVLTEDQVEVSRLFASRGGASRFDQVAHAENAQGLPYLHGAAAWFACRQLSWQVAGDHCLFIAEVEDHRYSDAAPLLFHAGGYHALGPRL